MSTKDGGPAFPHGLAGSSSASRFAGSLDYRFETSGGMSLRAYFAGQALVGYLAATRPAELPVVGGDFPPPARLAEWCVDAADALIGELGEEPQP